MSIERKQKTGEPGKPGKAFDEPKLVPEGSGRALRVLGRAERGLPTSHGPKGRARGRSVWDVWEIDRSRGDHPSVVAGRASELP
jgi:hypothetical protein